MTNEKTGHDADVRAGVLSDRPRGLFQVTAGEGHESRYVATDLASGGRLQCFVNGRHLTVEQNVILIDRFGPDSGAHARSAIGVAELPHGAPVEIEMIAAVRRR